MAVPTSHAYPANMRIHTSHPVQLPAPVLSNRVLQERLCPDVIITCFGKDYPLHRAILVSHSGYFACKFLLYPGERFGLLGDSVATPAQALTDLQTSPHAEFAAWQSSSSVSLHDTATPRSATWTGIASPEPLDAVHSMASSWAHTSAHATPAGSTNSSPSHVPAALCSPAVSASAFVACSPLFSPAISPETVPQYALHHAAHVEPDSLHPPVSKRLKLSGAEGVSRSYISHLNLTLGDDILQDAFEFVLDYMYGSSQLHLSQETVFSVLAAAEYFAVDTLRDACMQFLLTNMSTTLFVDAYFWSISTVSPLASRIQQSCLDFAALSMPAALLCSVSALPVASTQHGLVSSDTRSSSADVPNSNQRALSGQPGSQCWANILGHLQLDFLIKVLSAGHLAVRCEFERCQLVNAVLKALRQQHVGSSFDTVMDGGHCISGSDKYSNTAGSGCSSKVSTSSYNSDRADDLPHNSSDILFVNNKEGGKTRSNNEADEPLGNTAGTHLSGDIAGRTTDMAEPADSDFALPVGSAYEQRDSYWCCCQEVLESVLLPRLQFLTASELQQVAQWGLIPANQFDRWVKLHQGDTTGNESEASKEPVSLIATAGGTQDMPPYTVGFQFMPTDCKPKDAAAAAALPQTSDFCFAGFTWTFAFFNGGKRLALKCKGADGVATSTTDAAKTKEVCLSLLHIQVWASQPLDDGRQQLFNMRHARHACTVASGKSIGWDCTALLQQMSSLAPDAQLHAFVSFKLDG